MATSHSKYSLLSRINLEDLYNAFLGLEERQQILIAIGAAFLLLLILILPISCASSKLSDLEKDYKVDSKGRQDFMSKVADYQFSKYELVNIKQKLAKNAGEEGSLTVVIETIANEAGIGGNIQRLKPLHLGTSEYYDEEGVDAVISKVSLDQITDFLFRLEDYKAVPIKINKLQLKPGYRDRGELTATFQVSTIEIKGDELE